MNPPTKIIDYEAMVKQFAGDRDLFERFASKFLNSFEIQLAKIEQALNDNNRDQLKTQVHIYKNAVCNFHANDVYKKICEMEKLAVGGSLDTAKKIMLEVRSGSKAVADEIKLIQKSPDPMKMG